MPTLAIIVVHFQVTRASGYRYHFTPKHHGGDPSAGMWLPQIGLDEEYSVFDNADLRRIVDSRGWLYGIAQDENGDLQVLGTWDEQVAEFQPPSSAIDPWHGYPQWAVDETGPPNRRRQQCCPEKVVFNRMVEVGMITKLQRKRLLTGRPA
jgi:hypothetical protein